MRTYQKVMALVVMLCALILGALPAAAQAPVGLENTHRFAVSNGGVWQTCVRMFTLQKATAKCWLNAGRLDKNGKFVKIDPRKVSDGDIILVGIPTPVLKETQANATKPEPLAAGVEEPKTAVKKGGLPATESAIAADESALESTKPQTEQPAPAQEPEFLAGTDVENLRSATTPPNFPAKNQEQINREQEAKERAAVAAKKTEDQTFALIIALFIVGIAFVVVVVEMAQTLGGAASWMLMSKPTPDNRQVRDLDTGRVSRKSKPARVKVVKAESAKKTAPVVDWFGEQYKLDQAKKAKKNWMPSWHQLLAWKWLGEKPVPPAPKQLPKAFLPLSSTSAQAAPPWASNQEPIVQPQAAKPDVASHDWMTRSMLGKGQTPVAPEPVFGSEPTKQQLKRETVVVFKPRTILAVKVPAEQAKTSKSSRSSAVVSRTLTVRGKMLASKKDTAFTLNFRKGGQNGRTIEWFNPTNDLWELYVPRSVGRDIFKNPELRGKLGLVFDGFELATFKGNPEDVLIRGQRYPSNEELDREIPELSQPAAV